MDKKVYRILIAGEGGQGVQVMSHVLSLAAFYQGLNVNYMPNYGVEQRGGVSLGFLQIGNGVIGFPKFSKADIIVNMRDRAVPRISTYVDDNTLYIYDCDVIAAGLLSKTACQKLPIKASSIAKDQLVVQATNMVLTGALLAELDILSRSDLEKALDAQLAHKYQKKPQLKNMNKRALELGFREAKEAYNLKSPKHSILDELSYRRSNGNKS